MATETIQLLDEYERILGRIAVKKHEIERLRDDIRVLEETRKLLKEDILRRAPKC